MIEVSKSHCFSRPVLGQRTSPFLQEKLTELGCDEVFGNVPQRISSLLGIEVNESQVYRTCQNVAKALPEALPEEALYVPSVELSKAHWDAQQVVYSMVDGSMVLTDDGWQETKVGRIFQAELIDKELFKWRIDHSQYVAKRGQYSDFTEKFERIMPPKSRCQKVFVTDGASWIGQWIKDSYPGAVHILDFFHVCEKLSGIAPQEQADWLNIQKQHLLQGQCAEVIKEVTILAENGGEAEKRVLNYLDNNREKMNYGEYRKKGWMIGSGPIEAAHRTVLQVRMKRSGQRWANDGCDNLIKLRVVYKNNNAELIKKILKKTA